MMGKKSLSDIRADVQKAMGRSAEELREWFDRQLRKLERGPNPDPREIETLVLLRDTLARAGKAASRRTRRSTGTSS